MTITATAYAVELLGYHISGYGETPEAAYEDAQEWTDGLPPIADLPGDECRVIGEFRLMPISPALAAWLSAGGDPDRFEERDGMLITEAEEVEAA